MMVGAVISRLIILLFGILYPAYASYKAVRTKNVKEYVKWMMYWIVYAFFTFIETFTDIFLSWFPFYYEIKVLIVLWLLSPATKGSSTLYKKFVHPMLTRREPEIDEYINQAKEKGYTAVLQLGSKGVNYATNVIMQTALKTFQMQLVNGTIQPAATMIQASQSDYTITTRRTTATCSVSDDTDSTLTITRTQSVDSALSLRNQFEGSSEDEEIFLEHAATNGPDKQSTSVESSSARIREAPKRKARTNVAHGIVAVKKTTTKTGVIRGRRRLRQTTPDRDETEVIDVE